MNISKTAFFKKKQTKQNKFHLSLIGHIHTVFDNKHDFIVIIIIKYIKQDFYFTVKLQYYNVYFNFFIFKQYVIKLLFCQVAIKYINALVVLEWRHWMFIYTRVAHSVSEQLDSL